ncbi:MAG: pyruvate, phosphate dikinase [bacterium]|nr:pyruvate, phosphate dikinase [bacterium]
MAKKWVYFFGNGKADGNGKMKDVLGGKGAGLAEMTNSGVPVPPGFTISTEACNFFYDNKRKLSKEIIEQADKNLLRLEKVMNKKLGGKSDPLLVSVRSGSKFSMPGMMDTVLNLGLNDDSVKGLTEKTGNERFAYDAYRRFIQMFGNVVMGVDKEHFEHHMTEMKNKKGIKLDTELNTGDLKQLVEMYKKAYQEQTGQVFPTDPKKQLAMTRDAVFNSWNNPRAITYRKIHNIDHNLGTAVNVQAMVFGNMGNDSATGVGFTRNPSTGEKMFYGEYLINAQGEDVVAGIRTPNPIAHLEKDMPEAFKQLKAITSRLEKHYRDVQDFEFTIEKNTLYMLQTRNGKRTAFAAIKVAVDMVREKLITKEEAVLRVEPQQLDQMLHPILDPKAKIQVIAKGLNASPGAASGQVVFTAEDAVNWAKKTKTLLVRMETSPDDIHGMAVSEGILTSRGGATSHAVVVSRQMGKPCVAGCETIKVDEKNKMFSINSTTVREGDWITIDGGTGRVILGKVDTVESEIIQVLTGKLDVKQSTLFNDYKLIMSWADQIRSLKVRANADIPRDAKIARALGAEGIGLCRTEHMFFAEERLPIVQEMILADTEEDRIKALDKLLPMQKEDFKGLFREMDGYPVTIRLLDPPLHEFLPKREELMVEIAVLEATKGDINLISQKKKLLDRIQDLHEFNPMLGLRGCRLGIYYPEITRMQARAIFEAACELTKEGYKIVPEIMVPLVGIVTELKSQKELIIETAKEVTKKCGKKLTYSIGTMIELPRAAITADEIAVEAEFFSFGTNDLTQTTFGFSRDDSGKFLNYYLENGILETSPFQAIDQKGVGQLMKIGVEKGRRTRPGMKIGICGEHGGEPSSVEFCHRTGLSYVSCSPFRIPIARLAAAHGKLKDKK